MSKSFEYILERWYESSDPTESHWYLVASSPVSAKTAVGNYKKSSGGWRFRERLAEGDKYRIRTVEVIRKDIGVEDYNG
jgi:hypothetical protein